MEQNKICPMCQRLAYFDSYFSRYLCGYCTWTSDRVDQFKGNEILLDSFVNLMFDCFKYPENYDNPRLEVKNNLLKLLNSL